MKNLTLKIKDRQYNIEILGIEDYRAQVSVNGELYEVDVEQQLKTTKTPTLVRQTPVPSTDSTPATARTAPPASAAAAGVLKSPLPGKVLDILVKPGDTVSIGQTVICLEAMKMENNINSDRAGVVTAIHVHKGDTVLEGHVLLEIG